MHDPVFDPLIDDLVRDLTAANGLRAGPLVVTAFGDAVAPRGGRVALGGLLRLLKELGVNDSQVRTALSRLCADGWFDRRRLGRRSLYALSQTGRHRFEEATRRIYGGPPAHWTGAWRVVVLDGGGEAPRARLRRELGWLGFGGLSPGVLIHPAPDLAALEAVLDDLPEGARPLVIAGESDRRTSETTLRRLVDACWNLDGLADDYGVFLSRFKAPAEALAAGARPSPLSALRLRLLLIHDFRRIILRDPLLPPPLLAADWIGQRAYLLARDVYRAVVPAAEAWVFAELETDAGPLPAPSEDFYRRFGGLPQ